MSGQVEARSARNSSAMSITAEAQEGDIQLLQIMTDFEIREDIPAELEEVIWLSRLGLYTEARDLFKENLEGREWFFPVLIEYADLLLSEGAYQELSKFLAKYPDSDQFNDAETEEMQMLRALAETLCEDRSDEDEADFDDTETKLDIAVELCQNWHESKATKSSRDYDEFELHELELYLQIMVIAELDHHNIDEQYYHLPDAQSIPPDKWRSFATWCITLAQIQRFWEAQRIFIILLPVLSFDQSKLLFELFISQLEQFPSNEAIKVAELAASNAFLALLVARINRGKSQVDEVAEANSKAQHIKSLLLEVFGSTETMKGPRYEDWRTSVEKLGNNATSDLLQWPAKTEGEKTSETSVCAQSRRKLESRGVSASGQRGPLDFYPEEVVEKFSTYDSIVQVLSCRCEKCTFHLQWLELSDIVASSKPRSIEEKAKEIRNHRLGRSYRALFCLLVLINAPMLIFSFLDWKADDNTMQQFSQAIPTPTVEEIEAYWAIFQRNQPLESRQLAQKFRSQMYKFFLPKLQDQKIIKYPRLIVMPFENEQQLRLSNTTQTYSFQIHYGSDPLWHRTNGQLVRKVLKRATSNDAHKVWDFKSRINEHLLQPKTVYWHGKELNVICQKALGNLDECIEAVNADLGNRMTTKLTTEESDTRSSKHSNNSGSNLLTLRTGFLVDIRLWDQMRGLSAALDYLYTQKISVVSNIKPSNILLFQSTSNSSEFILKLGDFAYSDQEDERESYAAKYKAPEYNTGYVTDRGGKYAVYSLGCIFIELLIFAIYGPSGIYEFKQQIMSKASHQEATGNSVSRGANYENRAPHLSTIEFMSFGGEPGGARLEQEQYLDDLRRLFRRMVEPDVDQRYTITDVSSALQSTNPDRIRINEAKDREVDECLPDKIIETAVDSTDPTQGYEPCQIRGFTSTESSAFTVATGYDRWRKYVLGPGVCFAPLYAAVGEHEQSNMASWDFAIHNSSTSTTNSKPTLFRCYTESDVLRVQRFLIGYECKSSTRGFAKEAISTSSMKSYFTFRWGIVQLWVMSPRVHEDLYPDIRGTPEALDNQRLVIYQEDKIVVIPCSAKLNTQLKGTTITFASSSEPPKTFSSLLASALTRPATSESIQASVLSPPIIPTNIDDLLKQERNNRIKLQPFEIQFNSVNEARDFYKCFEEKGRRSSIDG